MLISPNLVLVAAQLLSWGATGAVVVQQTGEGLTTAKVLDQEFFPATQTASIAQAMRQHPPLCVDHDDLCPDLAAHRDEWTIRTPFTWIILVFI